MNEELSLDLYVKTFAIVAEIHLLVLTIITPSHRWSGPSPTSKTLSKPATRIQGAVPAQLRHAQS